MDTNQTNNIPKDAVYAGESGCGKTTLIKMINGLLAPTSGNVLINGMSPCPATKKVISYLPERTYLDNGMKVSQMVEYFADFYEDFSTEKAYGMLGALGISSDARLKTLSKGTKEKVQLILVMSRQADLYILDEPIAGVDPTARDYIRHRKCIGRRDFYEKRLSDAVHIG